MIPKIDFATTVPFFDNGKTKWYPISKINNYITEQQAENLPSLDNIFCFLVKGATFNDIVLMDNNSRCLKNYEEYSDDKYEIIIAYINMLKISKHFDMVEKNGNNT